MSVNLVEEEESPNGRQGDGENGNSRPGGNENSCQRTTMTRKDWRAEKERRRKEGGVSEMVGLCPPNPLGFIALGQTGRCENKRAADAACLSAPWQRSGRIPALPYALPWAQSV